jgi:hypothetical protein
MGTQGGGQQEGGEAPPGGDGGIPANNTAEINTKKMVKNTLYLLIWVILFCFTDAKVIIYYIVFLQYGYCFRPLCSTNKYLMHRAFGIQSLS